jgi:hypothetical protein
MLDQYTPMKSRVMLYPPGAGGSWLIHTLYQLPTKTIQPHFHSVWLDPELMQNIHHRDMDVQKISDSLVVFGGDSWFNIYLNLIYKLYHLERGWLVSRQPEFLIRKMINLITVIREHEIYCRDFVWEWLFYDWQQFYQCVANFQQQHQANVIDSTEFDRRRTNYIASCVNPMLIFEDWNSLYWICAVLGQAQYQKIQFDITEFNIDHLRIIAQQVYPTLDAIPCVNTKTQIVIPTLVTLNAT